MCERCGLVQQVPMPTADSLQEYYSHHYRSDYKKAYTPRLKHVFRAGRAASERISFIQAHFKERSIPCEGMKLLDVGAGGGEVVYAARQAGFHACGVEPNLGYSEFARANYGVMVTTGNVDSLATERFDIVTLFHVLEHIPNPDSFLERLHRVIEKNGYLYIEVPNIEQADASPHNIFFRAHVTYFSLSTLLAITSRGFSVVRSFTEGNIRVLLRRKDAWSSVELPVPAAVMYTRQRLAEKGWVEYLLVGGGLLKPFRRIRRYLTEALYARSSARETLDRAIRLR